MAINDVEGIENWRVGYRLPFPNLGPAICIKGFNISLRTMKKVRNNLILNGISVTFDIEG